MRTLPEVVETAVFEQATAPGYMFNITLTGGSKLYFSSRGSITYYGYLMVGGASVRRLSTDGSSASIALPNTDNAIGVLVLSGEFDDATVRIDAYYGDSPVDRVEGIYHGIVSSASFDKSWCYLDLTTPTKGAGLVPDVTLAKPLLNHMPKVGELIAWGGDVWLLDADDNG